MNSTMLSRSLGGLFVASLVAGCISVATVETASASISTPPTHTCPTNPAVPNASYVGPYYGVENNIPPEAFALDLYCADQFKAKHYKNGFVTIFGSSRIGEKNSFSTDPKINAANDQLYAQLMAFAEKWSSRHGKADSYPILSGAGPGLMEAASRGANSGSGVAVGYTTYYDPPAGPSTDPDKFYAGDAAKAFMKYPSTVGAKEITTDGLIFSSVAIREFAMIKHSAAIIIAPGGSGTQWEIFQTLETLKSNQLHSVPVYFVGDKKLYWSGWEKLISDLKTVGTLKPDAFKTVQMEFVENPVDVVEKLEAKLSLQ